MDVVLATSWTASVATTDKLLRLFQALGASDVEAGIVAASEICDAEEKMGHRTAARLLKGALKSGRRMNGHDGAPSVQASLAVGTALTRVENAAAISDVVLKASARKTIEELVDEWTFRAKLARRGLKPRNKVFFVGPPGCGKSLTATALGNALSLPTYIVRFDAIIGAFLGQTAIHLRQLFHFSETTPCVLVLDEIDALGKKRGNPLDVGELDRIVISLMQELEHANPLGLIVATSNLPKHIDDALWRRFDLVVEFPKPSNAQLQKYARMVASSFGITLDRQLLHAATSSKSYADCRKLLEARARQDVIRQG
jgi:SpoVK/Ycf46/Vps4 family AAA+-type ATPase